MRDAGTTYFSVVKYPSYASFAKAHLAFLYKLKQLLISAVGASIPVDYAT